MRRAFSSSCFICFERYVLLVHHNLLDLWLPVGGEIQEGESPQEAAYREAWEETGFHVDFVGHNPGLPYGAPAGFIGYEEHEAGPKGTHFNFCFRGIATHEVGVDGRLGHRLITDTILPQPRSDGSWSEFRWVVPGDISTYVDLRMPFNVRDCLAMIGAMNP